MIPTSNPYADNENNQVGDISSMYDERVWINLVIAQLSLLFLFFGLSIFLEVHHVFPGSSPGYLDNYLVIIIHHFYCIDFINRVSHSRLGPFLYTGI
jgi:hypothetical protein